MIFDGHADIWTDIAIKRKNGLKNIFKNYHLERFRQGGINGGIFVIWTDHPYNKESNITVQEIVHHMSTEIMDNLDIFKIIRKHSDLESVINESKMQVLIGIEGLSCIGNNVNLIDTFYMLGVRHASLTWNEENELATGVMGNPDRGLTDTGIKAVKKLEKRGMIIDLSHANDKTFWDIYNNTTKPLIASHSNCRSLCNVSRNLTDDQLKAIAKRGGVVGLNTYKEFVHEESDKQDLHHLVNQVDHMVKVMGIDHVAFGFDFSDYLEGDAINEDNGTIGVETTSKAKNIIDELEKRGYSKEDIDKISCMNFYRIIREILT